MPPQTLFEQVEEKISLLDTFLNKLSGYYEQQPKEILEETFNKLLVCERDGESEIILKDIINGGKLSDQIDSDKNNNKLEKLALLIDAVLDEMDDLIKDLIRAELKIAFGKLEEQHLIIALGADFARPFSMKVNVNPPRFADVPPQ